MKIIKVNDDIITFDNGSTISYGSEERYANNYADFEQLEELAYDVNFNEPLDFELCDYGFRFGNKGRIMFFIPCYSEQNGYYDDRINVYYNNSKIIETIGEII